MDINKVDLKDDILSKFKRLTDKPDFFLSSNHDVDQEFVNLTKSLYDNLKLCTEKYNPSFVNKNSINKLHVEFMDEEGIWSQIDNENQYFIKKFVKIYCENDITIDNDEFIIQDDKLVSEEEDISDNEMLNSENGDFQDNDEIHMDDNEDFDEENFDEEDENMENNQDDINDINNEFDTDKYNLSDDDDEGSYDDVLFNNDEQHKKKITKLLEKKMNDEEGSDEESTSENELNEKKNSIKSKFESEEDKLRKQISYFEEQNLNEKPWQLKGETDSKSRPQNSLLEEYVDFESGIRPPPVYTEELTKQLNDIIKGRIKNERYDDVERKERKVEEPFEYKKRIILETEKSKVGLAKIYEQEFLKQKQGQKENEENPAHREIRTKMRQLFMQLDSLCNFHYTPKLVDSEIKIVNNLPAISAEEAIPTAVSDSVLVAPHEVIAPLKGELKGATEKTKTDKLRERRIKKIKIKESIKFRSKNGLSTNIFPNKKKANNEKNHSSKKTSENTMIKNVFMKNKKK